MITKTEVERAILLAEQGDRTMPIIGVLIEAAKCARYKDADPFSLSPPRSNSELILDDSEPVKPELGDE